MSLGLLLGAAVGAAICLLVYALAPPRVPLGVAVDRWTRQRAQHLTPVIDGEEEDRPVRFGRWLGAQLARRGITLTRLRANLELTGGSFELHMVKKFGYALFGLLLPALLVGVMSLGGVYIGMLVPAIVGLVLAVVFFGLPDAAVVKEADRRRQELRRALSCYLDLVSMSLTGGRGLPETVPSCARIGSGWGFQTLQDTIDHARYVGSTPWAAFEDLGERTQVQELQDLGAALTLVADDGGRVRESLTARAASQRRRQLAEAEGAAAKADQSIGMAQVFLAIGFFVFLGYPALMAVLQI